MNYIRGHARGTTLGTGGYRRVRFRSCGTVGYGPTMWDKSRRSGDILHGHDSKACQRVACQLCRQRRRYQGRGTKRTIFLLVERGGPIGKVLVHRWLPECHHQNNRVFLTALYTEVFTKVGEYYCLDLIDHKKG